MNCKLKTMSQLTKYKERQVDDPEDSSELCCWGSFGWSLDRIECGLERGAETNGELEEEKGDDGSYEIFLTRPILRWERWWVLSITGSAVVVGHDDTDDDADAMTVTDCEMFTIVTDVSWSHVSNWAQSHESGVFVPTPNLSHVSQDQLLRPVATVQSCWDETNEHWSQLASLHSHLLLSVELTIMRWSYLFKTFYVLLA